MKLSPKAEKELGDILEVIQTEADIVKQDYEDNPSDMDSGSIVVVHEDSPLLKDEKEELLDIAYNIQPKINLYHHILYMLRVLVFLHLQHHIPLIELCYLLFYFLL